MKKRRLLPAAAGLALALVVAACGAKDNDNGGESASDKVYTIATDATYPPMENMDKDKIVGFDIDFLAAVMEEAGLKYELKNIGWDALLASLEAGAEFDGAISAMTITDERKQSFDFSLPYFESTNMILVKEDSPIRSALDLKGKKVAVQGGTTAETLMTGIMGEGNADLKRFESNALALMELEGNGVDAVVADVAVVQDYVKKHPDAKFKGVLDRTNFVSEFYGIALPKGSELKAKLDPAIKKVLESDKYKDIYGEWIGGEPDMTGVKEAVAEAE